MKKINLLDAYNRISNQFTFPPGLCISDCIRSIEEASIIAKLLQSDLLPERTNLEIVNIDPINIPVHTYLNIKTECARIITNAFTFHSIPQFFVFTCDCPVITSMIAKRIGDGYVPENFTYSTNLKDPKNKNEFLIKSFSSITCPKNITFSQNGYNNSLDFEVAQLLRSKQCTDGGLHLKLKFNITETIFEIVSAIAGNDYPDNLKLEFEFYTDTRSLEQDVFFRERGMQLLETLRGAIRISGEKRAKEKNLRIKAFCSLPNFSSPIELITDLDKILPSFDAPSIPIWSYRRFILNPAPGNILAQQSQAECEIKTAEQISFDKIIQQSKQILRLTFVLDFYDSHEKYQSLSKRVEAYSAVTRRKNLPEFFNLSGINPYAFSTFSDVLEKKVWELLIENSTETELLIYRQALPQCWEMPELIILKTLAFYIEHLIHLGDKTKEIKITLRIIAHHSMNEYLHQYIGSQMYRYTVNHLAEMLYTFLEANLWQSGLVEKNLRIVIASCMAGTARCNENADLRNSYAYKFAARLRQLIPELPFEIKAAVMSIYDKDDAFGADARTHEFSSGALWMFIGADESDYGIRRSENGQHYLRPALYFSPTLGASDIVEIKRRTAIEKTRVDIGNKLYFESHAELINNLKYPPNYLINTFDEDDRFWSPVWTAGMHKALNIIKTYKEIVRELTYPQMSGLIVNLYTATNETDLYRAKTELKLTLENFYWIPSKKIIKMLDDLFKPHPQDSLKIPENTDVILKGIYDSLMFVGSALLKVLEE